MRVVFMGTPEFAVPSLAAILADGYEVPLVVSTPDRQKGRGQKVAESDVKRFALHHGLTVTTPESLKDPAFIEELRAARPDVICVVAFRILPEAVYSIPPNGSFNLHASLLPSYRGAAPINWAIINGETKSGVTTFFLQKSVDTGSIILQKEVPIGPETTAGELHDALMSVGSLAVSETLQRIANGSVQPVPQDDSLSSPAPKIFRNDCLIDWSKPAEQIHNFIRGLSPYPAAHSRLDGALLKILRTRIHGAATLQPGELREIEGELLVGTGTTTLGIQQLQLEGRKVNEAADFLRGHTVAPETILS